ncbi:MAG: SWIM zinc finger family protein, partial [Planctomycetaceae bacterium]|nr:SWIM zinc finger family protein [Planctomycetaceae bacterium]
MAFDYYGFRPYVSVAERKARARREMTKLEKKGRKIEPIKIEGRKITRTFWGQAWCDHLESFSDFANRLPRGRSYVRNGSVCHLAITKGHIEAIVSGSELYNVTVEISTLPPKKWTALKKQCTGQIGSLLELLSGELSDNLMQVVTDRNKGLFPLPGEIEMTCDCPDWAGMCKHIAAVLYGVGARLDRSPGLLFELRGVDVEELIATDTETALDTNLHLPDSKQLASENLSDIFGIDMAPSPESSPQKPKRTKKKSKTTKSA